MNRSCFRNDAARKTLSCFTSSRCSVGADPRVCPFCVSALFACLPFLRVCPFCVSALFACLPFLRVCPFCVSALFACLPFLRVCPFCVSALFACLPFLRVCPFCVSALFACLPFLRVCPFCVSALFACLPFLRVCPFCGSKRADTGVCPYRASYLKHDQINTPNIACPYGNFGQLIEPVKTICADPVFQMLCPFCQSIISLPPLLRT